MRGRVLLEIRTFFVNLTRPMDLRNEACGFSKACLRTSLKAELFQPLPREKKSLGGSFLGASGTVRGCWLLMMWFLLANKGVGCLVNGYEKLMIADPY